MIKDYWSTTFGKESPLSIVGKIILFPLIGGALLILVVLTILEPVLTKRKP